MERKVCEEVEQRVGRRLFRVLASTSVLRIPLTEAELEETCLYVLKSMTRPHGYPAEIPLDSQC